MISTRASVDLFESLQKREYRIEQSNAVSGPRKPTSGQFQQGQNGGSLPRFLHCWQSSGACCAESFAIHIAIHNNDVYGVLPMTYSAVRAVTAEAAGSSPVVPAIHSKRVRRIPLKPSRARKGRIPRPICALFLPRLRRSRFVVQQCVISARSGRKDQRHYRCLRRMLRRSNRLCVNVQGRSQS